MEKTNNKNPDPDSSGDNSPKPPLGGSGYVLFYLVLLTLFLVITFFSNPVTNTRVITWSFLQDTLLVQKQVSKILVVNKEIAEIYINRTDNNQIQFPIFSEVLNLQIII